MYFMHKILYFDLIYSHYEIILWIKKKKIVMNLYCCLYSYFNNIFLFYICLFIYFSQTWSPAKMCDLQLMATLLEIYEITLCDN